MWITVHHIGPDVFKCRCVPLVELLAQTEELGVAQTEMWE